MMCAPQSDSRPWLYFRAGSLVCGILAILLLINPFSSTLRSPDGTSLRRPPSFRGTIGSSELDHFSPVSAKLAIPVSAKATLCRIVPSQSLPVSRFAFALFVPVTREPELSAYLWSRPPPVA